ncbi:hypothetical protein [Natrinema sp. H-ect4]|uniref:hypothetical protein n=1 Tax=Natrinema sp. H-ect4 TaxID=3242699 RepID=UPI0035A8C296
MKTLLTRAKHLYDRYQYDALHYECRRCGYTLAQTRPTCPTCGSTEIATIPL